MNSTGLASPTTTRSRLSFLIREIAGSGTAVLAAGVIAGGIGGRIAMRISAMVNPAMTGRLSENGNRIGSVTLDGTLALVLFGGLFAGIAAAWVWVAIRPWLPNVQPRRRWSAAAAAVSLAGFFAVESQNFDFFILEPAWLHIAMFAGIAAGAGALTEWFDGHIVNRFTTAHDFTVGAVIMLLLGVPIALPAMAFFFSTETCECDSRPWLAGTLLLVVLAATVATWVFRLRDSRPPQWLDHTGRAAMWLAIIAGLVYLAGDIRVIM